MHKQISLFLPYICCILHLYLLIIAYNKMFALHLLLSDFHFFQHYSSTFYHLNSWSRFKLLWSLSKCSSFWSFDAMEMGEHMYLWDLDTLALTPSWYCADFSSNDVTSLIRNVLSLCLDSWQKWKSWLSMFICNRCCKHFQDPPK